MRGASRSSRCAASRRPPLDLLRDAGGGPWWNRRPRSALPRSSSGGGVHFFLTRREAESYVEGGELEIAGWGDLPSAGIEPPLEDALSVTRRPAR